MQSELFEHIKANNEKLEDLSKYLTELESHLSLVFSAIPDMVIVVNSKGEILNVNNTAKRVLGYEPKEIKHHNIFEYIHPDDMKKTDDALQKLLEDNSQRTLNDAFLINRWLNKKGEYSKLAWRYATYQKANDCIIGFATPLGDLNEHSPFAFRLAKRAIACAKDGIIITDICATDSTIIYVNNAFCNICGYSNEELIGKSCQILHPTNTKQMALDTLGDAIKNGVGCEILLKDVKKDGLTFFNHLTLIPVEESGTVTNYIGISRDVTESVYSGIYKWDPELPRGFGKKQ